MSSNVCQCMLFLSVCVRVLYVLCERVEHCLMWTTMLNSCGDSDVQKVCVSNSWCLAG